MEEVLERMVRLETRRRNIRLKTNALKNEKISRNKKWLMRSKRKEMKLRQRKRQRGGERRRETETQTLIRDVSSLKASPRSHRIPSAGRQLALDINVVTVESL